MVGIEIKSKVTVDARDFQGLNYLKQDRGEQFKRGIVLYLGSEKIPFGSNLHALPVSSLWKT